MSLFRVVRAVADASGEGAVDWRAVSEAAKAATSPGSLALTDEQRAGYARDVEDARDRVRTVTGIGFDLPETVEVQHRHHWIDANVATFERVMEPLADEVGPLPGLARSMNSGTMAISLAFLANNVLGQYDPLLLAEGEPHKLYFVHPNIEKVARSLRVDAPRFRRWIAFHEVTHAAEFGAAPWLPGRLEAAMQEAIEGLGEGKLDREAMRELDTTMTAVEGYAELVMDRAFDGEYADLRAKLEARRRGRGPIARLMRRFLGLGMKRQQYERGKAFFDAVADARGVEAASVVWSDPEFLPTSEELDDPSRWLARVPV
ncbi:zinc-dependent metalloprotease [Salinirubellus salinus]|uniref:Zinc-dependent metalloprotease n=1 Tax=Salinirubellus salinus TaxID=1364945 RepID=A0A9E7R5S5_9EURY|nr:zinc-dependent metalloprotease [Salinirubellus salinus]UWM56421.1 zinc-dependent metalloprotease [Salinirubellus salinus]